MHRLNNELSFVALFGMISVVTMEKSSVPRQRRGTEGVLFSGGAVGVVVVTSAFC